MPGSTGSKVSPTFLLQTYGRVQPIFLNDNWFYLEELLITLEETQKINLFTSSSPIWTEEQQENKAGPKHKRLFEFLSQTEFSRPTY